jgi:hypothetical protein
MRIPGFSAEASLDKASGHHITAWTGAPLAGGGNLNSVQMAFGCGPCTCTVTGRKRFPFTCWYSCRQLCFVPPANIIPIPCSPPWLR